MRVRTCGVAFLMAVWASSSYAAESCADLSKVSLANGSISATQLVTQGPFAPEAGAAAIPDLPSFCRVIAVLRPSPTSDIRMEVWLPSPGWNGKFQGVGNGGWAGTISYAAMADAVRRGYATSSTDTGHSTRGGSFAQDRDKLIDFAYRSEHEMTTAAKTILNAFYGMGPRYSYWNGCSTGGRQGLQEASRFPGDYDGIIAGVPANPTAILDSWQLSVAQTSHRSPDAFIPASKYPAIHRAVLEACDSLDGLKDGLLNNPSACHFDPGVIACAAGDAPSCLTSAQMDTARALINPVLDSRGRKVYPGFAPGTELAWGALAGPEPPAIPVDRFKYVVYNRPDWDWRTFTFDQDLAAAQKASTGTIDLVDPNLQPFKDRAGKLLMYHGWSDPQVPPEAGIDFYKQLASRVDRGQNSLNWLRLFMVPGMAHCRGGEGPDQFDAVSALEAWVERGQAPATLTAVRVSNGRLERSRPLCPYPQVATYKGTGSPDDAANFSCSQP